jgi:hypothetical protein
MVGHVTLETRGLIARSQTVLYLVADPGTGAWIRQLNARAESLKHYFGHGRTLWESHQRVIDRILEEVRAGRQVCAVFYGHPGMFVYMSHEAIRRAREEGYEATMLPGISAEDCLIADLGIDTGAMGYHCLEATYFLIHRRQPDTASALILWQIGAIGQFHYDFVGHSREGLKILVAVLLKYYPPDHEVVVYEAPNFPVCDPYIKRTPLKDLPLCPVSRVSTLFVPPARRVMADPEMIKKLGIPAK